MRRGTQRVSTGYYSGPAVLVDHDGETHEVRAVLQSTTTTEDLGGEQVDGLTRWRGTLSGAVPWSDLFDALEPVTVRVGDREGECVRRGPRRRRRGHAGSG
jgi:hypothetical protein